MSNSATPWTAARQAPLSLEFPGKGTGVGCHFLLQVILLTQGSNPSVTTVFLIPHSVGRSLWEQQRSCSISDSSQLEGDLCVTHRYREDVRSHAGAWRGLQSPEAGRGGPRETADCETGQRTVQERELTWAHDTRKLLMDQCPRGHCALVTARATDQTASAAASISCHHQGEIMRDSAPLSGPMAGPGRKSRE